MKRFLFAGALALAAIGQARAADLPQPPPPPPQAPAAYVPVTAPVYNWGGIYFGVNGGYGFGTTNWTTSGGGNSGDFNTSGFLAGGTLGVNVQADAFVFGVEGDLGYSWITSGSNTNALCATNACETKNTWLSTVRGRIGYAADRLLIYGTAGGAFGNIQAGVTPYSTLSNTVEPGWTAGGGIEAAFAENWTARVEYLYVALENSTCSGFNCGPNPPATTVKFDTNLVRVGLDYKFR